MKRNWLEWVILAASVVAILVLVVYLLVQAVSDRSPATIRVEAHREAARTGESGWILPISVANDGGEPAEAVVIEAVAIVADAEQRSTLTIELLPPHSQVDAAVGFAAEPAGEVTFRVVAFESP